MVASARVLDEIIGRVLNRNEPFEEARMKNPKIRPKAMEMQAAAFDAARLMRRIRLTVGFL